MAAPPNEYSYDIDSVERAGDHWREREPKREQNRELLKQKRYTEVESKDRLTLRANRLLQKVRNTVGRRDTISAAAPEGLSEDLSDLVKLGPIDKADMTDALMERVIGETRDFLSVEFLEKGLMVNRSVGRVVTNLGSGRRSFGTGFMVSPRLLLTNWHVLKTSESAAESTVEFDYQLDSLGNALTPQRFRLEPGAFFLSNQALDFALVAVEEISSQNKKVRDFGWCRLIPQEGKAILGNPVNIIQHPLGEMKQVIIRENRLVDLPPKPLDNFAHYEGDTEPGSSGSPVFNDQWEVIALHHAGVPKTDKKGNLIAIGGGIWKKGDDPSRLDWIANEGIRISRLVEFIEKAKIEPHEVALRAQFLDATASPMAETLKSPEEQKDTMVDSNDATKIHSTSSSAGAITVTIPLTITIGLGSPSPTPSDVSVTSVGATEPSEDLLEKITPDKDYSERPGYDPDFLGFSVPLPKLGPSIRKLAVKVPDTGGHELKYYHYSVIMNSARRLAFLSAVNFEGEAKVNHPRDKGGDRWFYDPRIREENQAGEELYAGNPLDRGHLVRRADAAWGGTKKEAKLANDDTFHFTNCSPQHEIYNQSTKADQKGVLLWGNIENHIASQGEGQRLAVFNGPVFRANDRKHRGIGVPREFWKVVVVKADDGNPKALAFILSQSSLIKNLPAEDFEPGPFKPFQVRIRDLESKTKLDFGDLREHDPLENEANENVFEEGTEFVPLDDLGNIVY